MMNARVVLLAVFVFGVSPSLANADTLALYTFEEHPAETVKSGLVGAQLLDSSGNDLHFTKQGKAGAISWSADVPSVQPTDSTSAFINAAGMVETSEVDLSLATHPGLTIEFWYKPDLADTLRFLLDSGDGANVWAINQEVPGAQGAEAGRFNLEFAYTDNGNTSRSINTATTFSTDTSNSEWVHVAVVVNRDEGDIAIYFNGVEDSKTAGVDENIDNLKFEPKTQVLRLGSINPEGGFVSRAYLDDLRISNVALAPGEGSGEDELAWKASLLPTPK